MYNVIFDEMATDIVKGVIGHGASEEAAVWCKDDLLKRPYVLWYHALNHYKELYGYTSKTEHKSNGAVGIFPILNP